MKTGIFLDKMLPRTEKTRPLRSVFKGTNMSIRVRNEVS